MLPRPSRLKSLASELSPVLTTPPPVEPNTVFVLMSVPEMMLSSNLVVLRRRAATIAAMPARMPSAPAPIAQVGVLLMTSSTNDEGAATLGAGGTAFAGGVAVLPVLGSGAGATALGSGAFASGALASGVAAAAGTGGATATGGTTAGA